MWRNFLSLLIDKVPIPRIVKDRVPLFIRRRIQRLTTPSTSWELTAPEAMDEDLLGSFIRHYAHTLDKVAKTEWGTSKANSHAQHKLKLIEAIRTWHEREYELSDDISWAEGVIRRYEKWEKEKKLIEPTISQEIGKDDNIYDVIRHRRSIRYFNNKDIEPGKIEQILEAGRWAPCSGNRQAWRFIVQKRSKGAYIAKTELEFGKEARWRQGAVVIYVAIDERLYPEKYAAAMDAAAAIQNMLLMAHHLEIGGCWLYLAELVANQAKLRKRLGLEDYYYVYSAILLGYAAETPETPGRKPLDKIAKFIGFDSEVVNNND